MFRVAFSSGPQMKSLPLIIFLVFVPYFGFAQDSDLEAVTKTVNLYFDGMIERSGEKLEKAFLREARLIGYRGDSLFITPFEQWVSTTKQGSPRDPGLFKNNLLSIRIVGNTALAETELYWPGIYYYDFLTLIKIDGEWKIVHKTWHEKPLK